MRAAAYKAQRQRVYATGDDLNVSSPEKLAFEYGFHNDVKPYDICNLKVKRACVQRIWT